jgi:hypothetical protein
MSARMVMSQTNRAPPIADISVFALIVALFLSPKVSPRGEFCTMLLSNLSTPPDHGVRALVVFTVLSRRVEISCLTHVASVWWGYVVSVWCDDVEMRPAPPVQQFIWHISDTLHAVGFEAVAVAGLVAAMGVVIANFWRDVEATASAPPSFSTEQHDGIPIRDGAIERVDLADSATHSAELEEDEEDPPLLLGITIFIGTVVFMACSSASPLHVSVPPLTVHSIVTAENENLRGAIALLEAIAANVTLELSAES